MTSPERRAGLLRARGAHEHARVTNVELFFDLVFVFAVTQLSHSLLKNLTPLGAARTALLFLAVWWVWIYTSWVTNWLDPERTPVRLLLFALMLAGLVLSTSIPQAFDAKGLAFALAYVFMQVGRSLFMVWALGNSSPGNVRNFQRITAWLALAGVFWIAGAFAEGGVRLGLWGAALAVEYVSPAVGFWTPGLGRSTTDDWDVEGGHLAERCSLFIIIALGESLLVTGATFEGLPWTAPTVAAFAVAFVGSVAMWWIYFDTGAERGVRRITTSDDPGRLARLIYTYVHLLVVGGVIVALGRRRAGSRPSGRAHGSHDRGGRARRAGAVPPRQPSVQAGHRRPRSAVASRRPGLARRTRPGSRRRLAPAARGGRGGGAGHRRALGNGLAQVEAPRDP